ncbi:MAG TPA: STAS domain-containing protein [Terracidiphilus sp.]|jgi:anti-anti-sigma factor|nr:STAS domain-containing protein [Terracidiphilus sp.]
MKATIEELDGGITRIVLDGRMDIEGSQAIDLRMNVIAGSARLVLVDLAGVTFLGSMGLGSIVRPAQAIRRRGGKMVLLNPIPLVQEVLRNAHIDTIIPIHNDLDAALAELRA